MGRNTGNLDLSGIGKIEVNDGTGWKEIGSVKSSTPKFNGEPIKHFSTEYNTPVVDAIMKGTVEVSVDFTWEEVADHLLWQMVLYGGTLVTTNAGTQAITDEAVVLTGEVWKALKYGNYLDESESITVSSEAGGGGTTYVEGTDYLIDLYGGHIRRITGGGITSGNTVYVDYTRIKYDAVGFHPHENDTIPQYQFRWTKPLKADEDGNKRYLVVTHSKGSFSMNIEWPLEPGEKGAFSGVNSTIEFIADPDGEWGIFGFWDFQTVT